MVEWERLETRPQDTPWQQQRQWQQPATGPGFIPRTKGALISLRSGRKGCAAAAGLAGTSIGHLKGSTVDTDQRRRLRFSFQRVVGICVQMRGCGDPLVEFRRPSPKISLRNNNRSEGGSSVEFDEGMDDMLWLYRLTTDSRLTGSQK